MTLTAYEQERLLEVYKENKYNATQTAKVLRLEWHTSISPYTVLTYATKARLPTTPPGNLRGPIKKVAINKRETPDITSKLPLSAAQIKRTVGIRFRPEGPYALS